MYDLLTVTDWGNTAQYNIVVIAVVINRNGEKRSYLNLWKMIENLPQLIQRIKETFVGIVLLTLKVCFFQNIKIGHVTQYNDIIPVY